ncbi:MAG: four-helix bundle copper-binding protein [Isosphaeraceae bacterium]
MDRRELLGVLGAGALGVAATASRPVRADDEHKHHEHDDHLKTLGHCAKVCNEAAHHCLDQLKSGGSHGEQHARAHEATMDCQAFCTLTAALMARNSPMAGYAHQACADACRDCARACEGQQDEIMKECVKACRECESMCRSMKKG